MSVEMNHCRRAAPLRKRAKKRQRDAVVAAERNQMLDPAGLLLDRRQTFSDVAERDREVADIRKTRRSLSIDPVQRMLAVHQHPACLSYRRRSEPRSGPVGGAEVERNAGDADRRVRIVATDAEECRRNIEGRNAGHCC